MPHWWAWMRMMKKFGNYNMAGVFIGFIIGVVVTLVGVYYYYTKKYYLD